MSQQILYAFVFVWSMQYNIAFQLAFCGKLKFQVIDRVLSPYYDCLRRRHNLTEGGDYLVVRQVVPIAWSAVTKIRPRYWREIYYRYIVRWSPDNVTDIVIKTTSGLGERWGCKTVGQYRRAPKTPVCTRARDLPLRVRIWDQTITININTYHS